MEYNIMEMTVMMLREEFRAYLQDNELEQDYEGWEAVEISCGDTLSDAWAAARPGLELPAPKEELDKLEGRWICSARPGEPRLVLITTRADWEEQAQILAYELRYCLDCCRATAHLPLDPERENSWFFNSWLEYRAARASVDMEIWQERKKDEEQSWWNPFRGLTRVWGRAMGVCMTRMKEQAGDWEAELYYITRMLGIQSRIREAWQQELPFLPAVCGEWDSMPTFVAGRYSDLTWLSDIWDGISMADPDQTHPDYDKLIEQMERCAAEQASGK